MTRWGDRWILTIAIIAAVTATAWSYFNGYLLAYGDAESHLNIAKRVTDSLTPGLAQLGGIWLPLPHLLLIPFTTFNILWRTGLAGALVSGTAYIVSCIYLYKTARLVTNNQTASWIAFLVFASNPNILYMQSTAMTELPLIGFFILSTYFFIKYLKKRENILLLVMSGFFGLCATLTRYDGWFLVAAEGAILFLRMIPRGKVIMFATLAFSGIIAWFGWDGLVLGDPLYFTNSPFSAKSQQKGWLSRGQLLTFHNLPLSTLYYSATVMQNLGIMVTIAALLGLLLLITDPILNEKWELLVLFFVPFLFYVTTLFFGQSIILLPGLTPQNFEWQLFNIRYGLPMVPAAAFLVGYLAYRIPQMINGYWTSTGNKIVPFGTTMKATAGDWLGRMTQGGILAIIVFQVFLFAAGEQKVMVWEDGAYGLSSSLRYHLDAQNWMKKNYSGGLVLLDDYARTVSVIGSGIPMHEAIYIGNKPYWEISMKEPERFARWIVIQKDDDIWKNVYADPGIQARLYKYFQKVYTSPDVLIFRRNNEIK